jgi:hypothetical protein
MAFLDNSGDIILDAVLTDAGRARLARGDGSFKIAKYAFADDEIDYGKYDLNHASGSAYFDINILTTPVIEALTNNTSTMKNRLLSIPKTNLLYLPVLKLNEEKDAGTERISSPTTLANSYAISVNETTDDFFFGSSASTTFQPPTGVFLSGGDTDDPKAIVIDQGLNTTAISKTFSLDPTLVETQYLVEIDNRLGSIVQKDGSSQDYSFLDDDNIASYNLSLGSSLVNPLGSGAMSPIQGPRGTRLEFRIKPSVELNSSTYLFTLLGTSESIDFAGAGATSFNRIDSTVRITGATTGYRIDIPISFLRKV